MTATGKARLVLNSVKWRVQRRFDQDYKAQIARVRDLGSQLSRQTPDPTTPPDRWAHLSGRYRRSKAFATASHVPLVWFDQGENYGDLLSPWLLGQISGLPVRFAERGEDNIVSIGSIVSEANSHSVVWGSGSYGTERRGVFNKHAEYTAVRGPITRSRLLNVGISCPRVYGDPALLMPLYFNPEVEKTHSVGIVVRHTEKAWQDMRVADDVRLIDLKTDDVARTTRQILSCERIVSSSLHGLVLADTYGIPNAWLESDSARGGSRPFGGEFKFYDYFASVNKLRHAQELELLKGSIDASMLIDLLTFDDRDIDFDAQPLLDACPVIEPVESPSA